MTLTPEGWPGPWYLWRPRDIYHWYWQDVLPITLTNKNVKAVITV